MVGVGEDDVGVGGKLGGGETFDCGLGADGHEHRGEGCTMGKVESCGAGFVLGGVDLEMESGGGRRGVVGRGRGWFNGHSALGGRGRVLRGRGG